MAQKENEIVLSTGQEFINCVEFFSGEGSVSLLSAGCSDKVIIWSCHLKEISASDDVASLRDVLSFTSLLEITVSSPVTCMAWSPLTKYALHSSDGGGTLEESGQLHLCVAGTDDEICNIWSDLKTTERKVVGKHSGRINCTSIRSSLENDQLLLASASEDCTCGIWDLETMERLHQLVLKGPGVCVCWHPMEALQVLVGERGGKLRFYRVDTGDAVRCLEVPMSLMSAHWCPSDPLLVGAVAGTHWFFWDTSRSSLPIDSRMAHLNGAVCFRWSPTSTNLFGTVGIGNEVKVHHRGHKKVPIVASLPVATVMSWHDEMGLLLVAVSGDQNIHIWNVKD